MNEIVDDSISGCRPAGEGYLRIRVKKLSSIELSFKFTKIEPNSPFHKQANSINNTVIAIIYSIALLNTDVSLMLIGSSNHNRGQI